MNDRDREALILKYSRLVRMLASRYTHRVEGTILDLDDLVQIGMLGLIGAVDRYNNSGAFTKYAYISVRGAILNGIRDHRRRQHHDIDNPVLQTGLEEQEAIRRYAAMCNCINAEEIPKPPKLVYEETLPPAFAEPKKRGRR